MTQTEKAKELQIKLDEAITDLVKAINSQPKQVDHTNIDTVIATTAEHMGRCFLLVDQLTNLVKD